MVSVYARYTSAIRSEYIHYPYDTYLRGRLAVLQSFAARERLFFTDTMANLRESKARYNINKEMDKIQAAPEWQQTQ